MIGKDGKTRRDDALISLAASVRKRSSSVSSRLIFVFKSKNVPAIRQGAS